MTPAIPGLRGRAGGWRGWLSGLLLSSLVAGLLLSHALPAFGQASLPTVRLSAGLYLIQAEVAQTPQQLQQGLMFRQELGTQEGMLFVFPERSRQCMWMVNTFVPLSVAFLRDDGTIVNIADMQPQTRTSHCSQEPVRLALEMNQGWFAERGVKPGDRIRGLPELSAD